jgi:hypothetical protein
MKQVLAMSIAVVYASLMLLVTFVAEDTFLYNMLNDEDCYAVQHVQFEDGSCLVEKGV